MTDVAPRLEQLPSSHSTIDGQLSQQKQKSVYDQHLENGSVEYSTNGSAQIHQPIYTPDQPNQRIPTSREALANGNYSSDGGDSADVLCGPLLNFRRLSEDREGELKWHGSVLLVTKPGGRQPELTIGPLRSAEGTSQNEDDRGMHAGSEVKARKSENEPLFRASKIHEASDKVFWCIEIDVLLQDVEVKWEYTLRHVRPASSATSRSVSVKTFAAPAKKQSMRIMFHSCNGFSVGTDEEAWSGPALWNDVLRRHKETPFHVMIGGGDQIYNDGIRVDGPLRAWADMAIPKRRREHPFGQELEAECDQFYFQNYTKWYSTEPFATANGQIPQINIWDDHGLFSSFGSRAHHAYHIHRHH